MKWKSLVPHPPIRLQTEEERQKEAEMLALAASKAPQQASTKATLSRPSIDDAKHFSREIKDWRAVPKAKTREEAVGTRSVSAQEVVLEEGRRRRPKNERHQSTKRSVSLALLDKAVDAFMAVPGTPAYELSVEQKERALKYLAIHHGWTDATVQIDTMQQFKKLMEESGLGDFATAAEYVGVKRD